MSARLRTDNLSVSYGGLAAVTDVDLEVGPGELVGLIGPNGAGKTTTVDAISGFTPHRGSVQLNGSDVSALPAHGRARAGLARTWQSVELFEDLTVRQHCQVAAQRTGLRDLALDLVRPRRTRTDEAVDRALDAAGARGRRRPAPGLAPARPPEAAGRGPGAGRATRPWCCWTSPRPAWTRPRAWTSAAVCGRWSTAGSVPC